MLAVLSCDLSLDTIHISDYRQFSDFYISQGSVATYVRCGGIFQYAFVANLPLSVSLKKIWKSINIWGSYGQEFSVLFFIDSRCSSIFSIWERRPTYISKTGENTGYRKYRSINHRSWTVGRVFDKSMSRRDYGRTFNDDFIRNCSRIGERIYKNRLHLVRLQSALTPRLHKATNYRFLSVQAALPCFLHVFQCSSITDM